MKRRTIVKGFIAFSVNLTLIPACNLFQEPLKQYTNISLDRKQRALIDNLSQAILPTSGIENYQTLEPTLDFILTMVNDCHLQEDIDKYQAGAAAFQTYLKEKYNTAFSKIPTDKVNTLFSELSTSETIPEELQYFLSTTTNLTKQHFISSKYYQKGYMDFEFAPGRYVGCAAI